MACSMAEVGFAFVELAVPGVGEAEASEELAAVEASPPPLDI